MLELNEYNPFMSIEEKIVLHLQEKYNPVGIILHGSHSSGRNRPGSDWDIVVLTRTPRESEQELYEGEALDVDTVVMSLTDEQILQNFENHLSHAKILFDTEEIASDIVNRSQRLAKQGRKLSSVEYASKRSFLYRLLRRLESFEDNPGAFFYHLGTFYQRAIRYWFELKHEWSKTIYEALPEIQSRDPEFYKLLEVINTNSTASEKIKAAQKINEMLFGK